MGIKRYGLEELRAVCLKIFYTSMLQGTEKFLFGGKSFTYPISFSEYSNQLLPVDTCYYESLNMIAENEQRVKMLTETLQYSSLDEANKRIVKYQIDFLLKEGEILRNNCMTEQKRRYDETGDMDYSRTFITIPLNKKINSLYDDFNLEILFYDDITTPKGKYREFSMIGNPEKKKKFFIENTEVTHMGLTYYSEGRHVLTIGLLGAQNYEDPRVKFKTINLLPPRYADFSSLTLQETQKIPNNDLRQFFQTKIDLDKEDMTELAHKDIRGSEYWLYESPSNDLYIRYICPSTGRVYYNKLIVQNLALSKYFHRKYFETYLDSWWNITHIGMDPKGKEIPRC